MINSFAKLFYSFWLVGICLLFSSAGQALAQQNPRMGISMWYPTPLEILELPAYCHGQFIKDLSSTPGMMISGCGGGMNHFCPAMVITNRLAKNLSAPKNERLSKVAEALHEIEYTTQRMTPECPIKADVAAVEARLRMYQRMWK